MNYPQAESEKSLSPMPISHRLRQEKERLETRLRQVNEAIESLNNSPEVANAIEKLSMLGHF